MSEHLAGRVGSALTWKTVQLAADQGISLLRFLILARLLTPADFGLLAIATVAVDLLIALTNVGLLPALIQLRDPQRRHYDAAWTVASIRGFAIGGLLFVGAGPIAGFFGEPAATPVLQLIALRPLISGLASPRMADLERELNFRALALMTAAATIVHTIVAVLLVPTLEVYAVVVGMLASTALFTMLSYVVAPHRPRFQLDRASTDPILSFGRWVLATSIIGIVGEAGVRAVIFRQLGAEELGLYYVAVRFAFLPSGVVSEIVGSIAFPLHVRLRDALEKAAVAFSANLRALVAILLPAYVILIVLAPALTDEVLGPRWSGTAPVISLLALAALVGVIADAVFPMMEGQGRPERDTDDARPPLRSRVMLAWPLSATYGVTGAAAATLAAAVPVQIVAAAYARSSVPRPFRGFGRVVLAASIAGGTGAAIGLLVSIIGLPAISAALTAAAISTALLWVLDRILGLGLAELAVRLFPAAGRLLGSSQPSSSVPTPSTANPSTFHEYPHRRTVTPFAGRDVASAGRRRAVARTRCENHPIERTARPPLARHHRAPACHDGCRETPRRRGGSVNVCDGSPLGPWRITEDPQHGPIRRCAEEAGQRLHGGVESPSLHLVRPG